MATTKPGQWPIDPNVVDGTELATRLNDLQQAIASNHSSATRPTYVQAGGVWTETAGAGAFSVKLFDGTNDHTIGSVVGGVFQGASGGVTVGTVAPTSPKVGDFHINPTTKVVSWWAGAVWEPIIDASTVVTKTELATELAKYLPLTGGTLTGPLTSTSTIDADGAISSKADITAFKP